MRHARCLIFQLPAKKACHGLDQLGLRFAEGHIVFLQQNHHAAHQVALGQNGGGHAQVIALHMVADPDAGFPGLHLQLVTWGCPGQATYEFKGKDAAPGSQPLYKKLGFDSLTHYQWMTMLRGEEDYTKILPIVQDEFSRMDQLPDTTFFPHVSLGWDTNPRFKKLRPLIIRNNTPENVEKALRMAKEYVDTHDLPANLITLNSWNEWTETSYLQPDDLYGYGYLEAVRKVFLDENK